MTDKLTAARAEINAVDEEIARLFERRMKAAETVAAYKKENGLPIYDPAREEQVAAINGEYVTDPVIREYYHRFIRETMSLSGDYQRRLLSGRKVAFSGIEGAFAHIAARKIFPDSVYVSCPNFEDAYRKVAEGDCDCAVLPMENSFAGEVGQVTDLLFGGSLYCSGVYDLPVNQCLAVIPGTRMEQVQTVISHAQALAQCAPYIREHGFRQIQYDNTALAARYVKELESPATAAICSAECAGIFGLSVLENHINQSRTNTTRFGVVTRSAPRPGDRQSSDSTFLIFFTVANRPGALSQAVDIIARHGYNMCSLRSRPMKELLWKYYFCVECEGSPEADLSALLSDLSGCCDRLRLAGCYRKMTVEE